MRYAEDITFHVTPVERLLPRHKCSLTITHNDHRDAYQTVGAWLDDDLNSMYSWENEQSKARAVETDELWTMQWYPDTPVGFISIAAPTLADLLAFSENHPGK